MTELTTGTAFITGGAQGIGLGIARACAHRGLNVAIVDVDDTALERAEAELSAVTKVFAAHLDVRDRDEFAAVADRAEQTVGDVTLLCNNAGIAGNTPVTSMSFEAFDWVIGINLVGVYNGLQTFIPRMLARGGNAHILNTASGAGLLGAGAGYLYSASKAAIVGISESLRTELGPHGIGVTVLCPSAVNTGIIDHTTSGAPDSGGSSVMTGMDAHLKFFAKMLREGSDPDRVGEAVLDGIERDQQYVLTDRLMEEWLVKRTDELIAAMPAS